MWSFALLGYYYVDNQILRIMALIYATAHLCGFLVLRYTSSLAISTWTMLLPGWLFQAHFSFFTGGLFSMTLVWVGILPLIAGVTTNFKHSLIWSALATTTVILFIAGYMLDIFPPTALNQDILWLVHALTVLGMITLISGFTILLLVIERDSVKMQRARVISKAAMLQTMSHDIANPLSILIGLTSTGQSKGDEIHLDTAKSTTLRGSLHRILRIINTVRIVEGLDSNKHKIKLEPVSIQDCVKSSVHNVTPYLTGKNLSIEVIAPGHGVANGQRDIIEDHIITNILTNAIKFSPQNGKIKINIRDLPEFIEVSIQDEGMGIPSKILPYVFDPLAHTSRPGTSGETGTGFGLPIVKNFIGLLGGKVEIKSVEKSQNNSLHGTTVNLYFSRPTVL